MWSPAHAWLTQVSAYYRGGGSRPLGGASVTLPPVLVEYLATMLTFPSYGFDRPVCQLRRARRRTRGSYCGHAVWRAVKHPRPGEDSYRNRPADEVTGSSA